MKAASRSRPRPGPGRPAARRGWRAAPPPRPPGRSARSPARSRGGRCRRAPRAFCSTRSTVHPSRLTRTIVSKMSFTTSGARPIDGSSSMSSAGRAISARPMASICCSPPERVPGQLVGPGRQHREELLEPLQVGPDLVPPPATDLHVAAEEQVLPHGQLGEDLPALRDQRAAHGRRWPRAGRARSTGRASRTSPSRGRTSPHTALSSVVLPAPLAPTMATISPALTCSETRRSAAMRP